MPPSPRDEPVVETSSETGEPHGAETASPADAGMTRRRLLRWSGPAGVSAAGLTPYRRDRPGGPTEAHRSAHRSTPPAPRAGRPPSRTRSCGRCTRRSRRPTGTVPCSPRPRTRNSSTRPASSATRTAGTRRTRCSARTDTRPGTPPAPTCSPGHRRAPSCQGNLLGPHRDPAHRGRLTSGGAGVVTTAAPAPRPGGPARVAAAPLVHGVRVGTLAAGGVHRRARVVAPETP